MNTIRVEILNPKVAKLLKDLEELNLISIDTKSNDAFEKVLKKLRKSSASAPSLDEITKEVEIVRTKRHAK